jgi:serine/threonine protein kinase
MTSIPCPTDPELLALATDGAAPEEVLRHVSGCGTCGPTLARLKADVAAVRQAAIDLLGGRDMGTPKKGRDRVGELLGKYRLDAYLGEGATGEVYKATDVPKRSLVAVKVIRAELASNPECVERFKEGVKITAKLSHPNIVGWRGCGRKGGTLYLAMELIPGQTLEQRLIAKTKLPWQEVVDLGIPICEGLDHAHWLNIIHRDLKPSNIMITDDGVPKLTDYGIAKDRDTLVSLTAPGSIVGTPAYMAPEQWKVDGVVKYKADLYSLGVVFYQMLTGELPFKADTLTAMRDAHLRTRPPHPAAGPLQIPRVLDKLVIQLLSKNPDNRPRDAESVRAVLKWIRRELEEGRTVENFWPVDGPGLHARVPREKPQKPNRRGSIRAPLEVGGMTLALVLIGSIIVYSFLPPSQDTLYKQVQQAMASGDRDGWQEVPKLVQVLNRKCPENPYKDQTQEWCDDVALKEIEYRAKHIDRFGTPSPEGSYEKYYQQSSQVAKRMLDAYDWVGAASAWDELANATNPDEPRDYPFQGLLVKNPWCRLAKHIANGLRKETEQRRKAVSERLAKIQAETDAGRAKIWRDYMHQEYDRYKDVAVLLATTPPRPEPDPPKATATPATGTNGSAPSTPDR